MKTLGVIAQKGGTGKTTLSVHLAVQAVKNGNRVLLVDMDPQASASAWWKRRPDERPELVQASGGELPGVLEHARSTGYDVLVADTAPHNSSDSRICAQQADFVMIPTRPAILDLDAIGATTSIVADIGSKACIVLNACPPPRRVTEAHIVTEAREALAVYGLPICAVAVSQRAVFGHALIDGLAVSEFDPDGKAAQEMAQLWKTLAQEMDS